MKNHLLLAIGCLMSLSLTASAQLAQNQTTPENYGSPFVNAKFTQELCPPVEALTQNTDRTWSAPGGWSSNTPALLKTLDQFIGAQWIGVVVGEVNCQYIKTGKNRFPVILYRSVVVFSPDGGNWSEEKNGVRNCISTDIRQCRFYIPEIPQPKDIYEELNFFKNKAPIEDY